MRAHHVTHLHSSHVALGMTHQPSPPSPCWLPRHLPSCTAAAWDCLEFLGRKWLFYPWDFGQAAATSWDALPGWTPPLMCWGYSLGTYFWKPSLSHSLFSSGHSLWPFLCQPVPISDCYMYHAVGGGFLTYLIQLGAPSSSLVPTASWYTIGAL